MSKIPWTKNQKYFEMKLLELDQAAENPGGCHDEIINIFKKIIRDQGEACYKKIEKLLINIDKNEDSNKINTIMLIEHNKAINEALAAVSAAEIGND